MSLEVFNYPLDNRLQLLALRYGKKLLDWLPGDETAASGCYDENLWHGYKDSLVHKGAHVIYERINNPDDPNFVEELCISIEHPNGEVQPILTIIPPADYRGARPKPIQPADYRHLIEFVCDQGIFNFPEIDKIYSIYVSYVQSLTNQPPQRFLQPTRTHYDSVYERVPNAIQRYEPDVVKGERLRWGCLSGIIGFGGVIALGIGWLALSPMPNTKNESRLHYVLPLFLESLRTLQQQSEPVLESVSEERELLPFQDIGFSTVGSQQGMGEDYSGRQLYIGRVVRVDDFAITLEECFPSEFTNIPDCIVVVNDSLVGTSKPGRVFYLDGGVQIQVDQDGVMTVAGGVLHPSE